MQGCRRVLGWAFQFNLEPRSSHFAWKVDRSYSAKAETFLSLGKDVNVIAAKTWGRRLDQSSLLCTVFHKGLYSCFCGEMWKMLKKYDSHPLPRVTVVRRVLSLVKILKVLCQYAWVACFWMWGWHWDRWFLRRCSFVIWAGRMGHHVA